MMCQYCRSQNDIDAHRCNRCGRRTLDRVPVQMTAAVPDLETVEMPAPPPAPLRPQLVTEPPPPKRQGQTGAPTYQASLFGPVEAQRGQPESPLAFAKKPAARQRRDYSRQQSLDFQEGRTLRTAVEASVYCGAPVAVATHRFMAGAVDSFLAMSALGVFAGTLHFAGTSILLSKETIPVYGAAAVLILLFYRVLFCIANRDTPGIRWTGLQVLDFDGRTPTRRQRWFRLLGGFVGSIAAGIGLIWALFDEERLTWHDYMSKTFPTPRFL
jgi:uncharacterized RDD family membrane protein YckC